MDVQRCTLKMSALIVVQCSLRGGLDYTRVACEIVVVLALQASVFFSKYSYNTYSASGPQQPRQGKKCKSDGFDKDFNQVDKSRRGMRDGQ